MQDQATHIAIVLHGEDNTPAIYEAIPANSHYEAHAKAIQAAIEATPIEDENEAAEAVYADIEDGALLIVVLPIADRRPIDPWDPEAAAK
jgi:hypothetical protein